MLSMNNATDNYSNLGKKNTTESGINPMDYTGSAKVLIKIFKTVLTANKKTSGRQVSMQPTSLLGPVSIYRSISGSRRQPRA